METLEIREKNPDVRLLKQAVQILNQGGIVIIPTDSVYSVACLLNNKEGISRICKITGKKPEKANLSILFSDLKHISEYTVPFSKSIFKVINRNLPGPFTFILKANNKVPKLFLSSKKTIGIRVPGHQVTENLIKMLDQPLVSASLHVPGEENEYENELYQMTRHFGAQADLLIYSGACGQMPSTVVDCVSGVPEVIRQGEMPLQF